MRAANHWVVNSPFQKFGPSQPQTPVVVSVPHAGRIYPAAMAKLARQNPVQLRVLEDRHVDRLAGGAAKAGHQVIVAQVARAWIDLNRDEREIDPDMVSGQFPNLIQTAKMRGGLGLIPRRTAVGGDIWLAQLDRNDIAGRIEACFQPYHDELGAMIAAAQARFGIAVLLDLHSMPSPTVRRDMAAPHLVVGDLFGRASDSRFSWRLVDEARAAGFRTAINSPYAGGYILARHGLPKAGRHAVQLEIGRQLYLDSEFDRCGAGVGTIERLVTRLANALCSESLSDPLASAAE